jgi:NAD(P)-dependent dehydrogenase (short-subunit alcohol dehydrogenase family)
MNECVVITGGAGALGTAVAKRLAADGYAVAIVDAPASSERARALASELAKVTRTVAIEADASSAGAWRSVLARVEAELAPPTAAVLVAGGWQGGKPLHEEEDATWSAMMTANLETAHAAMRALLGGMVARKKGSIVVIGSRAAVRPWTSANASAYAASKAAVVALAEAAAAEVLDLGVRINAVLPSTLDTPANRRAMPSADPAKWVSLESAAAVVAFLLSEAARDVSGAALPLYGRA